MCQCCAGGARLARGEGRAPTSLISSTCSGDSELPSFPPLDGDMGIKVGVGFEDVGPAQREARDGDGRARVSQRTREGGDQVARAAWRMAAERAQRPS